MGRWGHTSPAVSPVPPRARENRQPAPGPSRAAKLASTQQKTSPDAPTSVPFGVFTLPNESLQYYIGRTISRRFDGRQSGMGTRPPFACRVGSMDSQLPEAVFSSRTLAAFAVHVFTACGAACALLALIAAASADWTQMFLWLGVALIVDGVDGTFARRLHVAELLPRWSGDVLDFVVDYGTYVLVPAYAIAIGGVLPPGAALPLGLIVAVTGAIYFADRRMKTSDSYFRGFPALWNVVALLKPAPWFATLAVLVLAAATFAPIHFVDPVRV